MSTPAEQLAEAGHRIRQAQRAQQDHAKATAAAIALARGQEPRTAANAPEQTLAEGHAAT